MTAAVHCSGVTAADGGQGSGVALTPSAVRLSPAALDIQPRDFEKLTVFIDTGRDTRIGDYRAVLQMGEDGVETVIDFEVVAADG